MKKNRLLSGLYLKVICILITFFSLNLNTQAASFAYNDFNWDKFYKENKNYWSGYCVSSDMDEEECMEHLLSNKKEFYTRMYKLLAKYEKKGYKLDDNIILATVFYGLTPDTFTDSEEQYLEYHRNGSSYNLDLNFNIDSYDINYDEDASYFENETDTLKTLTKHMFAYKASCKGKVANPEIDKNGEKICYQGTLVGDECIGEIKSFKLNYSEHLVTKHKILKIFGMTNEKSAECEELGGKLETTNTKSIDYDIYWEFLKKSNYLDNKAHLNSFYNTVLEKTNHKYMTELGEEEKETYKEDIMKVRERITKLIKSVYDQFKKYAVVSPDSFNSAGCTSGSAWWPIGSDETIEEDGILFAKGDPATTTITSPFGQRIHPIKMTVSHHAGIDIGEVTEGVTNVIAVKDGVVIYPTEVAPTNCPSSYSLDSCGGGYGNYVIIQHNDGTYSLYAHLYTDSITVRANDSVKQGQVIGKAGTSGNSTGPHLHFEIRQGSNSSSATIDPTTVISAENPRSSGGTCSGGSSELIKVLHWLEVSCNPKTSGDDYIVINAGDDLPCAGYGVCLQSNRDRFSAKGIDVSKYTFGSKINKAIVDEVEVEFRTDALTYIRDILAKNNITLKENQIDALLLRFYNTGNINNFAENYLKYGDTQALYDNYMSKPVTAVNHGYMPGLVTRRNEEWQMFHEGIYIYGENC